MMARETPSAGKTDSQEDGQPRRRFIVQVGLAAASASVAAAAASCSGPEQSTPAQRQPERTFEWKMVTAWPKNFPGLGTGANHLAQTLEAMSGGRLKIKVYGAGELVPALGVFDAVSRGTVELGHSTAYYWKGKHEAAQFFAAVPFGLTAAEMNGWLRYGGGQELWDELYGRFDLQPFSAGNTGVQMGGWFNREINSTADFNGLKMRMPGLGGEVLSRLGAAITNIPGGEIFQALKTGVIDATEWVGPYNDLAFGFHQAARYYYWPGWHEPGTTIEAMVNKPAYEELPDDLQEIVKRGCQAATDEMMAEFTASNNSALKTLVGTHGVQLRRFPDEVVKALGETAREVVAEIADQDPFSRRVYESFSKFRSESNYTSISEQAYTLARELTFG